MQAEIIIIGAGMAGLMAGRVFTAAGKNVLILDKGRRIGGRMSSRRDAGLLFNHGAQFVTAHSPIFKDMCTEAAAKGIVGLWPATGRDMAFSGQPSMRDIASFIGADLNVQQEVEIEQIVRLEKGGFALHAKLSSENEPAPYHCQHLLVTAPAPQTAQLLQSLSPPLSKIAAAVHYAPSWTVMAELQEIPDKLAPILIDKGIIGWASCEASRPGASPSGALTIQASAAYSEEFLEAPAEKVTADLLADFAHQQHITAPNWGYQRAHRWRYAKVIKPAGADAPFMESQTASLLATAGDWHPVAASPTRPASGARAEEAVLSGHRAAREMLQKMPA